MYSVLHEVSNQRARRYGTRGGWLPLQRTLQGSQRQAIASHVVITLLPASLPVCSERYRRQQNASNNGWPAGSVARECRTISCSANKPAQPPTAASLLFAVGM